MRELSWVAKVLFVGALQAVLGSTEVVSKMLVAGASAGVESHGRVYGEL